MSAAPEPSALPPVTPTDEALAAFDDASAGEGLTWDAFLKRPPDDDTRAGLAAAFPHLLASYLGVPGANPAEALHQLARLIAANAKREAVRQWIEGLTPQTLYRALSDVESQYTSRENCAAVLATLERLSGALAGLAGEGQAR